MEIGEDVIKSLQQGSHQAFHQVFVAFYPKVFAFAMGFLKNTHDAEDNSQTVFIKLWTHREKLANVHDLDAYLYTITKNTVLNYIASQKAFTIDISTVRDLEANHHSAQQQIEAQDLQLLIEMIVENMPTQRQTVYRMSREQGLSNDEIAERLGLQKKTVENHLNLALGEIRKMLKILILLLLNWV